MPFLLCWATALVLVTVYNPYPTRPFRTVFSWVHRLSGVGLVVAPIVTLLRHRGDFRVHLANTGTAWRWRLDDIRWLLLMGPATFDKRIGLPHQEKFNAAEKINFMTLSVTWPLYAVTGVLIWLPGVAYLSWLIHISMAAAATPLIVGHIFMATVNPDTRVGLSGMVSGYVDRHWAHHHYRHWFDEMFPHLTHAAPAHETVAAVLDPGATVDTRSAADDGEPLAQPEPATSPITAALPSPALPDDEPVPGDDPVSGNTPWPRIPEPTWPPFLRPPSAVDSVEGTA